MPPSPPLTGLSDSQTAEQKQRSELKCVCFWNTTCLPHSMPRRGPWIGLMYGLECDVNRHSEGRQGRRGHKNKTLLCWTLLWKTTVKRLFGIVFLFLQKNKIWTCNILDVIILTVMYDFTVWSHFETNLLVNDGAVKLSDCSGHAAPKINCLWFLLGEMKYLESDQITHRLFDIHQQCLCVPPHIAQSSYFRGCRSRRVQIACPAARASRHILSLWQLTEPKAVKLTGYLTPPDCFLRAGPSEQPYGVTHRMHYAPEQVL